MSCLFLLSLFRAASFIFFQSKDITNDIEIVMHVYLKKERKKKEELLIDRKAIVVVIILV
jgi:hypothetical protein